MSQNPAYFDLWRVQIWLREIAWNMVEPNLLTQVDELGPALVQSTQNMFALTLVLESAVELDAESAGRKIMVFGLNLLMISGIGKSTSTVKTTNVEPRIKLVSVDISKTIDARRLLSFALEREWPTYFRHKVGSSQHQWGLRYLSRKICILTTPPKKRSGPHFHEEF